MINALGVVWGARSGTFEDGFQYSMLLGCDMMVRIFRLPRIDYLDTYVHTHIGMTLIINDLDAVLGVRSGTSKAVSELTEA